MSSRSRTWRSPSTGVAGFSATAGEAPALADVVQRAMEVGGGLGVHDDHAAAGLEVAVEQVVGSLDHQVGLERHGGDRAARGDHVGSEGEVRYEVAVHDVPLDAVDAGLLQGLALLAQAGHVGREHGRDDLDRPRGGEGHSSIARHRLPSIRWVVDRPVLELTTTGVAAGGAAVARDGTVAVVFVRGALPGERVRVGRHRRAALVRRRPAWPRCWRLRPNGWNRPAPTWPRGAAAATGSTSRRTPSPACEPRSCATRSPASGASRHPMVAEGEPLPSERYRTTVRGAVVGDRFAYRRWHSHDSLAVGSCLIAHPLVEEVVEDGRFPGARQVTIRAGAATGERLVVVDGSADGVVVPDGVAVVGQGRAAAGPAGLVPRGGRRPHVADLGHVLLPEPPRRRRAARATRSGARPPTSPPAPGRMADLCAGVGLFAGTVGAGVPVIAVERDRSAVADARHNLGGRAGPRRAGVDRGLAARPRRPGGGRPASHRPRSQGRRRRSPAPGPTAWCSSAATPPPSGGTPACSPRPATATPGRPSWTCSRTPPTSRP